MIIVILFWDNFTISYRIILYSYSYLNTNGVKPSITLGPTRERYLLYHMHGLSINKAFY